MLNLFSLKSGGGNGKRANNPLIISVLTSSFLETFRRYRDLRDIRVTSVK